MNFEYRDYDSLWCNNKMFKISIFTITLCSCLKLVRRDVFPTAFHKKYGNKVWQSLIFSFHCFKKWMLMYSSHENHVNVCHRLFRKANVVCLLYLFLSFQWGSITTCVIMLPAANPNVESLAREVERLERENKTLNMRVQGVEVLGKILLQVVY